MVLLICDFNTLSMTIIMTILSLLICDFNTLSMKLIITILSLFMCDFTHTTLHTLLYTHYFTYTNFVHHRVPIRAIIGRLKRITCENKSHTAVTCFYHHWRRHYCLMTLCRPIWRREPYVSVCFFLSLFFVLIFWSIFDVLLSPLASSLSLDDAIPPYMKEGKYVCV
jgi:hypothetical protein